jgi:NAD(P)-dependent dehydrogenase (short-subunit alcohol dehydrogenase family)
MLNINFEDHVVIIAGAGGNLGSSVASKFIASGANLILVDYEQDSIERLFPDLIESNQHMILQGFDVNDRSSTDKLVSSAMEKYGKIDVMVNTIGGYKGGSPLHETTDETWNMLFNLNARSVFNLSRSIIPILKDTKSGKIIHIAARRGLKGAANEAVYSAAKSAVIRLTESMAQELKFDGINVNCVLPGTIDTPQNRAALPDADFSRWVDPDAISDVILFLASDSARGITGASIPVYGKS